MSNLFKAKATQKNVMFTVDRSANKRWFILAVFNKKSQQVNKKMKYMQVCTPVAGQIVVGEKVDVGCFALIGRCLILFLMCIGTNYPAEDCQLKYFLACFSPVSLSKTFACRYTYEQK